MCTIYKVFSVRWLQSLFPYSYSMVPISYTWQKHTLCIRTSYHILSVCSLSIDSRGVRRRITPSSTRFFGQNFTPSPSIIFIDASTRRRVDAPSIRNHRRGIFNKKFTKNCLKFVNIGQEMTFFKEKKFQNFLGQNFLLKCGRFFF